MTRTRTAKSLSTVCVRGSISCQLFFALASLCFVAPGPVRSQPADIDRLLSSMDLEQKVGQLMMVGFGGQEMSPEIARLVQGYHIGSVALYSRNIVNTEQMNRLVLSIRALMSDEIQPFIAVDQEGGNVVRVHRDVAVLPGAMAIGATRDPVLAFLAGQAAATDLRLLGIDMNLAPVLDVNHNPANQVINIRAYGDHPSVVSRMGVPYAQGQQVAGVVTVAKHFPGHGNTVGDSHFSLPSVDLSLKELQEIDLVPFQEAIDAGLDAIMTAHILVPSVDASGTPASLSYHVITELLRNNLGFQGLVITDDLEMRAITERMDVGEAAIRAVLAGADMVMVIWTPQKKIRVFEALLGAVRDGRIPMDRIDESVRRILETKARRGTLDFLSVDQSRQLDSLPNQYHLRLVNTIARRSVTLVQNKDKIVPLCQDQGVLVASPLKGFLGEMKRLLPGATTVPLYKAPSAQRRKQELDRLLKLSKNHRVIVIGALNAYQAWLAQQLEQRSDKALVVVSFGTPYMLQYFPQAEAYLCSYSYLASAQRAAAQALSGRISITGKLPVTLADLYPRGHGAVLLRDTCVGTDVSAWLEPIDAASPFLWSLDGVDAGSGP